MFKSRLILFPVLGAAMMAQAQTPTKVGIIHIQNAIISTKDGQKAANDLQNRFAPKKAELDKKQNDVAAARDQLQKGSNTMSNDAKEKLMRDIDQKTKALNRDTEDAQAELDQEQGKIMQDLGGRMMAIIDKYAKDNGFSLILDVSNPQTPVLYAANNIDITNDIVALYDKNAPAASSGNAPPSGSTTGMRPATATPVSRPGTQGTQGTPARQTTPPAPAVKKPQPGSAKP